MVQEETATDEEQQEVTPEATPPGESSKASIHIWMPTEAYELIKKVGQICCPGGG